MDLEVIQVEYSRLIVRLSSGQMGQAKRLILSLLYIFVDSETFCGLDDSCPIRDGVYRVYHRKKLFWGNKSPPISPPMKGFYVKMGMGLQKF